MEITLEPTKKAVSQFRDLWNSPSVISPSKQSHDSVALELVMMNAYKFSINLGKIGAFDQLGGFYGSVLPPHLSSTVLSRLSTETKVQSTGSVIDWFKFWEDKIYNANNESDN